MPIDPVSDSRADQAGRGQGRPASAEPARNGNGAYPYRGHWTADRPDDPEADPLFDTLRLGGVVPPPERPGHRRRPGRGGASAGAGGGGGGGGGAAGNGSSALVHYGSKSPSPLEDEDPPFDFFDDEDDDLDLDEVTSSTTRNLLEWAVVLVGAVLVALLLRATLFQAFWIPSESMETTLLVSDRVLVNKVSYRMHDINRGDVVVFTRPDYQPGDIKELIKRVIGLPGETVEGHDGSIYINERRLDEPYLGDNVVIDDFDPIIVPEDHVFVMGDNRDQSMDSRVFGPVPQDLVVGRAFVLFWPPNRISSL